MKITQVEVAVHEKRNNPFAFGHYDCGVTLTAEYAEDAEHAELDVNLYDLRDVARGHVAAECDSWERGVRRDRRYQAEEAR